MASCGAVSMAAKHSGGRWGFDPDQRCHPTAAKKWFMASRRISNIEVAGIATIVLSVAAVLAVILLSVW
jgi:hypothetical protein